VDKMACKPEIEKIISKEEYEEIEL